METAPLLTPDAAAMEDRLPKPRTPAAAAKKELRQQSSVWFRANPKQWPDAVKNLVQTAATGNADICLQYGQVFDKLTSVQQRKGDDRFNIVEDILRKYQLVPERKQGPADEIDVQNKSDEIQHNLRQYFRKNSPETSVEAMYQLIHLAPSVAGILLDLSLDPQNENEVFLSLKGKIKNKPMRCRYTEEANEHKTVSDIEHEQRDDAYAPNVYEVTRYNCLFHNILNINVFQALAKTEDVDLFAKKSIQAMLRTTWHEEVGWVVRIKMVLCVVEILTLMCWGLSTKDGFLLDRLFWLKKQNATDEAWLREHAELDDQNSESLKFIVGRVKAWSGDGFEPVKWSILAALNLEQLVEFVIRWFNATFGVKTNLKKDQIDFMNDLWSDRSYSWQMPIWLNSTSIHWCIRTLFLICVLYRFNGFNVMVYSQQFMLSLTFFTSVFGISTFFTTFDSEFGFSLVTMRKTLSEPAVLHFVFVLAMLFTTVMMAWMMLDRENIFMEAFQIGWRALVLSEDERIDEISDVNAGDLDAFGYIARAAALMLVFFFSTFLTNLFVAIFSDAYAKARKKVLVSFWQNRLFVARNCILAQLSKIPLRLQPFKPQTQWRRLYGAGIGIVGVIIYVGLQWLVHIFNNKTQRKIGWVLSILSILVFTLMISLVKAIPFKYVEGVNHWFSAKSCPEHVMIVWCRSDFKEKAWLGAGQQENDE